MNSSRCFRLIKLFIIPKKPLIETAFLIIWTRSEFTNSPLYLTVSLRRLQTQTTPAQLCPVFHPTNRSAGPWFGSEAVIWKLRLPFLSIYQLLPPMVHRLPSIGGTAFGSFGNQDRSFLKDSWFVLGDFCLDVSNPNMFV